MAAPDAVGNVAVARSEVRRSLERLEYHLGRGAKGARGVRREIAYLDALHRQTVRLSGRAVGAAYTGRSLESFGQKAAEGLASSGRAAGRMKSSILADFSSDGLQPARDWTLGASDRWIWTANASACPTCLSKHGRSYTGGFIPSHPSCLCIPTPFLDARDQIIRPLSHDELVSTAREYGDPRYYKRLDDFENGLIDFDDLAKVENVNAQRKGLQAFQNHIAKGEVRQVGLPGASAPAPAPTPAPAPAPAPTTPKLEIPENLPKPEVGGKAQYKDFGPFDSLDDYRAAQRKSLDDLVEGRITEAAHDELVRVGKRQYQLAKEYADEVARLEKAASRPPVDLSKRPQAPKTFRQHVADVDKGKIRGADVPDTATIRQQWDDYAEALRARRLGKATNAERLDDLANMGKFSDEIADDLAKAKSNAKRIELIEDEAQRLYPLTDDGIETFFDLKGMSPEMALEQMDALFDLAKKFPEPATRMRYMGTLKDTGKMMAGRVEDIYPRQFRRHIREVINGTGSRSPSAWAGDARTNAWVTHGSADMRTSTMMAVNPSKFKSVQTYMNMRERGVNMGWYPSATSKPYSTVVHEFGHLVDYWMDDIARMRPTLILDAADSVNAGRVWLKLREAFTSPVSQYAKRNKREEWAEYFSAKWIRGETADAEWAAWERYWALWDDKALQKVDDISQLKRRYDVTDEEWAEFLRTKAAWEERVKREFPELSFD